MTNEEYWRAINPYASRMYVVYLMRKQHNLRIIVVRWRYILFFIFHLSLYWMVATKLHHRSDLMAKRVVQMRLAMASHTNCISSRATPFLLHIQHDADTHTNTHNECASHIVASALHTACSSFFMRTSHLFTIYLSHLTQNHIHHRSHRFTRYHFHASVHFGVHIHATEFRGLWHSAEATTTTTRKQQKRVGTPLFFSNMMFNGRCFTYFCSCSTTT